MKNRDYIEGFIEGVSKCWNNGMKVCLEYTAIYIDTFFKEISELKNREIVTILKNDFEIVMVYLNTGKIWEAFLKKDDKIYLNTGLDVSIDITDIAKKYYKKS